MRIALWWKCTPGSGVIPSQRAVKNGSKRSMKDLSHPAELFFNGRKPVLRPSRYSLKRMRTSFSSGRENVRERILHEAAGVLIAASNAKPTKYIRLSRNKKKAQNQKQRRAVLAFKKPAESKFAPSERPGKQTAKWSAQSILAFRFLYAPARIPP